MTKYNTNSNKVFVSQLLDACDKPNNTAIDEISETSLQKSIAVSRSLSAEQQQKQPDKKLGTLCNHIFGANI